MHPRCRCAIIYDEDLGRDKKPKPKPKSQIDLLPTVGSGGSTRNNLLDAVPKGVGLCRTFDELKIYWADNYNVKVATSVTELNFEAVRAAMSGVEAVLEEFLQSGAFLEEFDVYSYGLMSTLRGHGKIYFNPEIFSSAEKVTAEIVEGAKKGYYPKNMTAIGVGAHEAGHIVEDWLIKKFRSIHTEYRPIPRRLTHEAYQNAILTTEGKGKSLEKLKAEITNYALENYSECLASAVSDYIINAENAAVLSRAIWHRLKEELNKMLLASDTKLWQYPVDDIMKYCIFENGDIVGVKDDAPAEFKEAYDWEKKKDKERWAAGIA